MPFSCRSLLLLLVLTLSLSATGCVSRRLTVRSNPPGALVEVNGERIGITPASMDFTYYGTYEFRISKPGYETKVVQQRIVPPWYQVPPLDAVSDNLIPVQVTNRHEFDFSLAPLTLQATDDNLLLDRGQNFRTQSRTGQ